MQKLLPKGILLLFLLGIALTAAARANAATLNAVSDTITTSRPSPSTPLSADAPSGSGSVAVYNNGSIFLASDSAHFYGGTPENVNVSTMSATNTNIFFTSNTANTHLNGTVVATPITAVHTVKFTTITNIPASGSIVITFPTSNASDTNQASPSASTFMPNGLLAANIVSSQTSNLSCSLNSFSAGGAPTITCNNTNSIAGGTTITIMIGCSAGTSSCTTQVPTLINPTKTASAGVADIWKVAIDTYSGASGTGTILDNGSTKIGTIESVQVIAHIEPTFTFTISGVANNTAMSALCSSNGTTTNTGIATTATSVNLGTLTAATVSYAAQEMVITSNAISGYSLTATSSGHLLNPSNGYFIADAQGTATANDTPAPAAIAAGGNKFGIHPCDLVAQGKVNTTTWGNSTLLFANPSPSYYYTLVNSSTSPAANGDTFYVEYGASPQGTTPPGDYRTTLTYVATSVF